MAKVVSSVKKMSVSNKFKKTKDTTFVFPKPKMKEDPIVYKDLPEESGNVFGSYVLNVMKLS